MSVRRSLATPKRSISIIGAGLGGLTLGCALKARGIPCVIYERKPSATGGGTRHGYTITLFPERISTGEPRTQSLPSLLGKHLDWATVRGVIGVGSGTNIGGQGAIHQTTLSAYERDKKVPNPFRAYRATLESLLSRRLDIRWNAKLSDIRQTEGHRPVLMFEDGSKIISSYVIAADGVHSQVRKSLLPSLEPTVLPFVVFNGRRRMPKAAYRKIYQRNFRGATTLDLLNRDGVRLQLALNEARKDNTQSAIELSYTYSRQARENDRLHRPDRRVEDAVNIPDEFYNAIAQLHLPEGPFADAFDVEKVKNDRILHWLMRVTEAHVMDDLVVEQLSDIAARGIYFMGDAVHAHPIVGGYGANLAIADALHLSAELERRIKHSVTPETESYLQQPTDFYRQRITSWRESIKDALHNIYKMHNTDHIRSPHSEYRKAKVAAKLSQVNLSRGKYQ